MKPPHTVNMMAPPHTGPPGLLGLPTSSLFDPPAPPTGTKALGWRSEGNNKVVPVDDTHSAHTSPLAAVEPAVAGGAVTEGPEVSPSSKKIPVLQDHSSFHCTAPARGYLCS